MEYRRAADAPGAHGRIIVRLDKGDEVVSCLRSVCAKENISSALVNGIGACRRAEIAHYDTKEKRYHNKTFEGMLEIVSLSGNIVMKDGAPFPHIHISLGLTDFTAAGGHLVSCEINPTCEIAISPLPIRIDRKMDMDSGLALQRFQPD